MSTVSLELEPDLLALLHQANRPSHETAKEMIVLELYRRGSLSSGRASALLGLTRFAFIAYASRLGIPYLTMSQDEWEGERARSRAL